MGATGPPNAKAPHHHHHTHPPPRRRRGRGGGGARPPPRGRGRPPPAGRDADARRAFGQALRVLAHKGELERVVLVSHHEDLADVADEVYRVTKNGRGSAVELVS